MFTDEELELADAALGELVLPHEFVPVDPHPKQEWFLLLDDFEAFFGGAAGPGKSWALLMAALQYVDQSGYRALLLRPSLTEFEQQGGLIEVSHEWLGPSKAWWHGGRRQWTFPSGATLRFGYLAHLAHLAHYPGGGVSFLGFDELTLFDERLYLGMFRLLRQPVDRLKTVPVRVRSASNPGNAGHGWVKGRFVDPGTRVAGARYVRATIADNPSLDYETYLETLSHMHPIDRARLIAGDWDAQEEGGLFKRADFMLVEERECPPAVAAVRYWDLAATEETPENSNPDWTCGMLLTLDADERFTIRDVAMEKLGSGDVETLIRGQAVEDGYDVSVFIEQDPGAAGKIVVEHYQRSVLQGFACYSGSTKGKAKDIRARPVSAAVANGNVRLVRGRHFREVLSQCAMFPQAGFHDDVVDALSGGHTALTQQLGWGVASTSVPRGRIASADRRASAHVGGIVR